MPEQGRHKRTYQEIAPRVALETLVRIAAVQENVAIEVPPRPTVRARLGVPRAGDLASHVGRAIVEPVGRYGDSKEYEIERLYGDAPLLLIGEGTCEIPRMVIGKKLLQRQPR